MASTISDIKPAVISTVATVQAHPEGEMDALLLGRTRVSREQMQKRRGRAENAFCAPIPRNVTDELS